MYIEEFRKMIAELEEMNYKTHGLNEILISAAECYLLFWNELELYNYFEFIIEDNYIEQTDLLNELGIKVFPKRWEEQHSDYDNPFGPSDAVNWKTIHSETRVEFPISLLTKVKKDDVLNRVRNKF